MSRAWKPRRRSLAVSSALPTGTCLKKRGRSACGHADGDELQCWLAWADGPCPTPQVVSNEFYAPKGDFSQASWARMLQSTLQASSGCVLHATYLLQQPTDRCCPGCWGCPAHQRRAVCGSTPYGGQPARQVVRLPASQPGKLCGSSVAAPHQPAGFGLTCSLLACSFAER